DLGLLTLLGLALLRLELELAVVHDLTDGRLRGRRNLHEVKTDLFGHLKRFADVNHPDLLAIGVDQADLGAGDVFVDAWSIFGRRRRLRRSSYLYFSRIRVVFGPCGGRHDRASPSWRGPQKPRVTGQG